ncbi:MAG TPA: PilZ domain-containing protein [Rhizomicrobium sp.]|nr:PilZ domain-containing protein [Rhizomicrobium sp.]
MTQPEPAKVPWEPQTGADRRRFRRVKMDLPGRLFLPADGREAQCTILDMSPGGMAVLSEIVPDFGSAVVLYLDGFGRFEGHVVRHDQGGFGLAFACTPSKRKRTAEQLILFLNTWLGYDGLLDRDSHAGQKSMVKFTRADGQIVQGELSDISVNGVSLKTDVKPPLGEFVLIAQIAGRVCRHHADGIGIDFVGNDNAR